MTMQRSWVVVHKGARDAYQVALALEHAGTLDTLVTDWYSPLDRGWFRAVDRVSPSGLRGAFRCRYREGLPSTHVRSYPRDAVFGRFEDARARPGDAAIGRYAGRLARRHGAGILAYSCYAHAAFASYKRGAGPKVIFQVHPHPVSLRRLFADEIERSFDSQSSLEREPELSITVQTFEDRSREALLADACIVASNYTRQTLIENGVEACRIQVVPYGVDLTQAMPPAHAPSGRFRVLFVGQVTQRKGIQYLLEAWKRLALPDAELVLAGRGGGDAALLAKYEGHFRCTGPVSADALRTLYQTSDLLCMPSLAEGFGLVYLESLAHGTPVIATPNTGAADLIHDGDEGFIVGIRDVEALMDRLRWCYEHRDALAAMRVKARQLAERHSWATFQRGIVDALARIGA